MSNIIQGAVTPNEDIIIMHLKVTAVSPIYTGENKVKEVKERKTKNRIPTRKSGDGFATINLSGILRAFSEKMLKSSGACDVARDAKGCGRPDCITCDMYGYLGKKGRVCVDELKTVRPFNEVVDISTHPRIDRDTGVVTKDQGPTIELEEIQEGAELVGNIVIRNPKERDIEVITGALKAIETHGLGGWTRRGRGRTKIDVTLEKIKWSTYKDIGKEEARKLLNPDKEKDKEKDKDKDKKSTQAVTK
ncbi:MAG: hypothetical protein LAN71_17100 [Acidobacteriia bacterium]|nr:hypothetical protein [Terriglobia bacterium]